MPGKVNPSQCEALTMVALHVFGCHATVAIANAQGPLQLNVYKPLILYNVLESARLLRDGATAFTTYCAVGLEAVPARIEANLQASLMLVTALVPHLGYERAAGRPLMTASPRRPGAGRPLPFHDLGAAAGTGAHLSAPRGRSRARRPVCARQAEGAVTGSRAAVACST